MSSMLQDKLNELLPTRCGRFVCVLFELVVIGIVIALFQIEQQRHLFAIYCYIVAGFTIHTWLPRAYQRGFFACLCVVGILFILGLTNGAWVLGLGGILIGICLLPISWLMRLACLILSACALAWFRSGSSMSFWPVLGSCFMFRLFSFFYEIRRTKVTPTWSSTVAYFFLLPNACFPLFPVVDFRVFQESRNHDDEWAVAQRGVAWIVRGLAHLLLYRFIRSYCLPELYEMHRLSRVVIFMTLNYALYVQVSGQFHLITGLLHLFGWDLPRTHHCYFLASSFTDIWRRINIYWKEFLAKHVFYPVFYAVRRRGASLRSAMIVSTLVVFVATWLLHSWQTFWLLGRFPITINDACLWLGAGIVVAGNAVWEARSRKSLQTSAWLSSAGRALQTILMFLLISVFWGCWTKPGFLTLLVNSMGRPEVGSEMLRVGGWLLSAWAVGTIAAYLLQWRDSRKRFTFPTLDFYSSVKLHLVGTGLVAVLASPWSATLLPERWEEALTHFRGDPVAAEMAGERLRSYYEDLNQAVIQAGPLVSTWSPQSTPRKTAVGIEKVIRQADHYQLVDLVPGIKTELEGHPFSVNSFGMRDRDTVTLDKPKGVKRIAVVGSSIVMGYGVGDDETFCRDLENELNRSRNGANVRYEVLNFGVGRQWAPHRLVRIQNKVIGFQPDLLIYIAHPDEYNELANHPAQLLARGLPLPSPHLQAVINRAGVTSSMAPGAILGTLKRHENELLSANYRTIVEECETHKIVPVWIFIPIPGDLGAELGEKLLPLAKEAGFHARELANWTTTREGIFPDPKDPHPNARGHALIAAAVANVIRELGE